MFTYNWPYDFCSTIELAKITTEMKVSKNIIIDEITLEHPFVTIIPGMSPELLAMAATTSAVGGCTIGANFPSTHPWGSGQIVNSGVATNYDPDATYDDGSCQWAPPSRAFSSTVPTPTPMLPQKILCLEQQRYILRINISGVF